MPVQHATFDLETYSAAGCNTGLKSKKSGIALVGAHVYAHHPTTRILMFTYDLHDGRGMRTWLPGCPDPTEFLDWIKAGNPVEAHNSKFEYWVWNAHKLPHWPTLRDTQMRCSMAKALSNGLPGAMANISSVLQLDHGGKFKNGTMLIKKFSVPDGLAAKPGDYEDFVAYNRQDVLTEYEVSEACDTLSPVEQGVWLVDHRMNDRGVPIDEHGLKLCEDVYATAVEQGNRELLRLTGGRVATVRETAKLGQWLIDQGEVLPKTAKGNPSVTKDSLTPIWENTENSLVKQVIGIRQELSLASVDKMVAMRAMLSIDGRIHGILNYYGATHTGRWTSTGPQFQNLPAKGSEEETDAMLARFEYGNLPEQPVNAISGVLRGLIKAPDGRELIGSDYSAIEARVLAELAGEPWRQEVFRTHGKIYETSASKITGIPFSEFEAAAAQGNKHPARALGKVAELASGYGGWIAAWVRFGALDHLGSEEEIKQSILAWRQSSPNIVELWGGQIRRSPYDFNNVQPELYGAEGAVVKAILQPRMVVKVNEYLAYSYDPDRQILFCHLPSGRKLYYRDILLTPTVEKWSKLPVYRITYKSWSWNPKGWFDNDLYGGRLVNNFTQATARDIMAHALVSCENAGYKPILTVHDEILSEIPAGWGSIDDFESILMDLPDWCNHWPIKAAGGWRGRRFRKG